MPIELHTIGIKAVRLPQNLKRDEVAGIIMAGLAGALDHSLRPGDVIVDEASIRLPGALPFKVGKFHTSEGIIASPDIKAILFRASGALAVEMENGIVRNFAHQLDVPYWGVRAISDTAEEALDPRLFNMIDELGRPKLGAMSALFRPSLMKEALRLGAQAKNAGISLGRAVKTLVEAWPAPA